MQPTYSWKARLVVGIIMLLLAFVGMIITDIKAAIGWNYWKWMVFCYAVLALALSAYTKKKEKIISPISLWRELLHWLGTIGVIFLTDYLVHLGTMSSFVAGIFQLILLCLSLFLAGVYIESTFLVVAIVLAIFALLSAILAQYVYFIIIPIIVIAIGVNIVIVWMSHRKFKNLQK